MSEFHNDSEPKSTSKESSYLDKNCRHVIVVAVKMGLAEFPEQATTLLPNQIILSC